MLKNETLKKSLYVFFVLLAVYAAIGIGFWNRLQPQIPLYYSLPHGEEQLASPVSLILLPLFSVIFFFANFFIASLLYLKEKVASYLLVFSALAITFLMLVTFIKIIFLVV